MRKMFGHYYRVYYEKLLLYLREKLERSIDTLILKVHIPYLRNEAIDKRATVIRRKGHSVVDKAMKRKIKEYALKKFGSTAYWPYLALYTEIRGEFIEGWIPYDYFKCILIPKLNPKPEVYLNDLKTYDYRLYGDFAIMPLLLFISDNFMSTDLEFLDRSQVNGILKDFNNRIVVKEEGGYGGYQVKIQHSSAFNPDELKKGKNYVIQPYIEQYEILSKLNPETLNTFRVNTFMKSDGSIEIKHVFLRFGVHHSRVDNLSMGGQCIEFDAFGKPSEWSYDDYGFKICDRHPETGFLFSDVKIPMFDKMLDKCREGHRKYPYIRLIGWDVCITVTGEPKLVEWNARNPDFWTHEALKGPIFQAGIDF